MQAKKYFALVKSAWANDTYPTESLYDLKALNRAKANRQLFRLEKSPNMMALSESIKMTSQSMGDQSFEWYKRKVEKK